MSSTAYSTCRCSRGVGSTANCEEDANFTCPFQPAYEQEGLWILSNSLEHALDDDMEVEFTGKCHGPNGFGNINDAPAKSEDGTVMPSPLSESEAEQPEPEPESESEHEKGPEPELEPKLEPEQGSKLKPQLEAEAEHDSEHEQEQQHQELDVSLPEQDREVNEKEKHDEGTEIEGLQENQASLKPQESQTSELDASASPGMEPIRYPQQSSQANIQHLCLLTAASVFLLCWLFFHVIMILLLIVIMVTPKIFHGVCAVVNVSSWIYLFVSHQLGFA